jgi:hypothetical protein
MNEEDLRDCFAMFAMCGIVMRDGAWNLATAEKAWAMADCMLETRKQKEEPEVGIVAVKKRKTK